MCVVIQTIERVARELHVHAERLIVRAEIIEHLRIDDGDRGEAQLIARNMRRDAEAMRASAKLLDGKDR